MTGLLVRRSEGRRSLGVLVVHDLVVFALVNVAKELVGRLHVDKVGCVDLRPGHSFVRMVLKGQVAVGFPDGGGISCRVDAQDGVVIDEKSHSHWHRHKYKVKDAMKDS